MSLQVQNLSKSYGTQRAVDGLSFEVGRGEILGFLGPNGAGKSTTMKMVSGYVSPTSGTAKVCGHDILTDVEAVKSHIGYLPEHNPLYLDMFVREYLQFVAGLHKMENKTQRINEVIERTGLGKEAHKHLKALSKGYRQRVGIAQAIMHDPDILILDEPTSGLDMNQLVEIRSLITELGQEKTVILSTHIMQEVQALCSRVIIINNGKLVADDPIERLRERIRGESKIVIQLQEKAVDLAIIRSLDGILSVSLDDQRIVVTTNNAMDMRPALFRLAVDKGWTLLEMRKEELNVEHVFQKLTNQTTNA